MGPGGPTLLVRASPRRSQHPGPRAADSASSRSPPRAPSPRPTIDPVLGRRNRTCESPPPALCSRCRAAPGGRARRRPSLGGAAVTQGLLCLSTAAFVAAKGTTFHSRDGRLGHARLRCQISLAPPELDPDPPDGGTEPLVAHVRSLAAGSVLTLNSTPVRFRRGGQPAHNRQPGRGNAGHQAWTTSRRAWTGTDRAWKRENARCSVRMTRATTTSCVFVLDLAPAAAVTYIGRTIACTPPLCPFRSRWTMRRADGIATRRTAVE